MKKTALIIALAAALPALTTLAQPGPGEHGGHRPPPPPIIKALDANGDGVIDAQELANASAALATLDKNGDGQLTGDELHPRPPQGEGDGPRQGHGGPNGEGRGDHPVPPMVAALDANQDGTIDAQELANASTALKALDANNDGQLTREELRPPRPEGDRGNRQ